MLKKFICILLFVVVGVDIPSGCDSNVKDGAYIDRVSVSIGRDFKDRFLAAEFTIEDFEWNNIESIEYHGWYEYESSGYSNGAITVYLRKHGKRRVKKAIEHIETLEFVSLVQKTGPVYVA